MSAPYVVSSDLETLWSRAGVVLPQDALKRFRLGVSNCLKSIFGGCEWITETELSDGIQQLLAESDLPIVCLDKVYARNQALCIDASRLHDKTGEALGLGSGNEEYGTMLALQVQRIAMKTGNEVALVDDVLFSGKLCKYLVEMFQTNGVTVRHIYTGVAIGHGINKVESLGCKVKAVRIYETVVDQVCERDFMPGAPFSGRTVVGLYNTGMPYLLPYGRPESWASIPAAYAATFSATCLKLAAEIYYEIGMRQADLPRNIHGMEVNGNTLVCEHLMKAANSL